MMGARGHPPGALRKPGETPAGRLRPAAIAWEWARKNIFRAAFAVIGIIPVGNMLYGIMPVGIVLAVSATFPGSQAYAQAGGRIVVYPLLFFPRDVTLPPKAEMVGMLKLRASVAYSRAHFRHLLKTDTFAVEENRPGVFRSAHRNAYFMTGKGAKPDSAHRMMRELLARHGETRESARRIYLIVYVRPRGQECSWTEPARMCLGGARSLGTYPEPGGGIVQMEYSSLIANRPYRFLSTLVHEIGHAFGLTHVNCMGYDMKRNGSIMSYNQELLKAKLGSPRFHGGMNPEEYALLSLHKRAFPQFRYDPALHNPTGRPMGALMRCLLGPMDQTLGLPLRKGYRLYYNGKLVSGPEAALYTYQAAEDNCRWNRENRPGIKVGCTFHGRPLSYWRERIPMR